MRCIDADTLEKILEKIPAADIKNMGGQAYVLVKLSQVFNVIDNQPTIEPRKKGHWIKGKMWSEGIGMGETYGFYYACSECNSSVQGGYDVCGKNFCEKCGADMREPEDIPMEYFESEGR